MIVTVPVNRRMAVLCRQRVRARRRVDVGRIQASGSVLLMSGRGHDTARHAAERSGRRQGRQIVLADQRAERTGAASVMGRSERRAQPVRLSMVGRDVQRADCG